MNRTTKELFAALVAGLCALPTTWACSTIAVGRQVSATGCVLVGHNEDDGGALAIRHALVPARRFKDGEVLLAEKGCAILSQVPVTAATYWSEVKSTAGGPSNADAFFNEYGVLVVSDNGAPAAGAFEAGADLTDGGVKYNLRRCVGERAKSARDAVDVIVSLVERWGYAMPGRIYTVADSNEAWAVQIVKGKRCIARRCPDDGVMVVANCFTIGAVQPGDVLSAPLRTVAEAEKDFDFARRYQGASRWKADEDFYRTKHMYRLLGCPFEGWPQFAAKPARPVGTAEIERALSTHYEGTEDEIRPAHGPFDGRDGYIPVCRNTTVESSICVFAPTVRETTLKVATGAPCRTDFRDYRPFAGELPPESVTGEVAAARLDSHVRPEELFTRFGNLIPGARVESQEPVWPESLNRPTFIRWYEPDRKAKLGTCLITVSGGGFKSCCDAKRLRPVIDRAVRAGLTVADLTYRTPRPKGLPIHQHALEDLQRAIRLVRSQAVARGFNPERIGALGISAGSKAILIAATSSLTPEPSPVGDAIDAVACHLNYAIPICPAYVLTDGATDPNTRGGEGADVTLVPELKFDAKTCPMCMIQGGLDQYSPLGSTQIYRQLRRMSVPAEVHLLPDRPHDLLGNANHDFRGAGIAADGWISRAFEFMRQLGFMGQLAPEVAAMTRFSAQATRAPVAKESVWPKDKTPDFSAKQGEPYIEWFVPEKRTTAAIQIVYSGGGYNSNGPEGHEVEPVRRYLTARGMTVVTLRYRTPRPAAPLPKHLSAWQDLQRAIRIVRSQAAARGLDPDRIGIMGFSAGGHLTLMGATTSLTRSYGKIDALDDIPCSVQWAVAIYPAYSLTDGADGGNKTGGNADSARLVPEFAFDLATCPILFVHGDGDGHAAMGSVKCWEQLRRMGVQGEVHTLVTRGHCFHKTASPGTGSWSYYDRIWQFLTAKKFNRP